MKIGEFCGKYNLSPETVRFYINKGLLCPIAKNNRYDFQKSDCKDMEFLLRLKSYRFSIMEIHKILSLWRFTHFESPNELEDYILLLEQHKKYQLAEKNIIQGIISSMQKEINSASGKPVPRLKNKIGVSLAFLKYLACPLCGGSLSLTDCTIELDQILSGKLLCKCGYNASIQNGILMGHPGAVSTHDWPDLERNCYRLMNPTLASYMQKSYHWLLARLHRSGMKDKVILEDFVNNYCFCHANIEEMDKDALYIITDKFPEIVTVYKGLIDRLGLEHRILYVAAASELLPLKENCVDYYIDFDSANEYALYHEGYSTDAIQRYLKDDSCVFGVFFSFKRNSSSFTELHRQFPEAWHQSFDISSFKRYLSLRWKEGIEVVSVGNVVDQNINATAALYHISGEVGMDVYFAHGCIRHSN